MRMRSSTPKQLIVMGAIFGAIFVLPATGEAQEAVMTGVVTDTTGGVLPGVTVQALHEASGNSFEGVTDERGMYRMPVRTGIYSITAQLPGFTSTTRRGLEVLVGQQLIVSFELAPSGLQESVTVTAEAPLLDVTSSSLGGNIDPRQMQELPVNGRNWQDLVVLAPGNRLNAVTDAPGTDRGSGRSYSMNLDGQEVSQNQIGATRGQPRFSRESIAEFQFLSSRFDATVGRNSGVLVNAITKSGTNTPSGTFSGYFRDDRYKAADFVSGRVLPYSNQQLGGTFGGPILRDRLHLFTYYEYEREPKSYQYNTPYPSFNILLSGANTEHLAGIRLDYQLSPQLRLMGRGNIMNEQVPYEGVNTSSHPAAVERFKRHSDQLFVSLTQVLGNRSVNEVRVGFSGFFYQTTNYTNWPTHPRANRGITTGSPRITFRGFAIAGNPSSPQKSSTNTYSVRDDFTHSYNMGGRHDIKAGFEYLYMVQGSGNCRSCMGQIDAQGGPIPANLEQLFPVWNDPTTWNLAAISPITRRYQTADGQFRAAFDEHNYGVWLQDDWFITPRLTLNLGVRYDLGIGVWGNWIEIPGVLEANRPDDKNNIAPRLGMAFSLNDRTVLRGGYGAYFGELVQTVVSHVTGQHVVRITEVLNDGRPDFAANPFNGPFPTFDQMEQRFCLTRNVPGCLLRAGQTSGDSPAPPPRYAVMPYSHQASAGVQRQVGTTMAVEADYSFTGGRAEVWRQPNVNLSYNPATGANYPFSDASRRPIFGWGFLSLINPSGWSNLHSLQTSFTRRMSNRWQASATYTLSTMSDSVGYPLSGLERVPFPVTADLGPHYAIAATDQRHRAVLNGIWDAGFGFQLSGIYFYGSGERFATNYGGDLRQTGQAGGGLLRPDGTIAPRAGLVGNPIHRMDMRVQRRFGLGGVRVDGIMEVFNVFNHANYGSYVTAESNVQYGRPVQNNNVAYQPRMLQLGFRAAF